mgnify:CR=1 FL=1
MQHDSKLEVTVTLGDGVVVLHRSGQSKRIVANVLGVERADSGEIQKVWLDRLVHRTFESEFADWHVSGAVSTVLIRKAQPAAMAKQ